MALGDDRVRIAGPNGQTYWYNPNTGRVFPSKTSPNVIEGATVTANGTLRLPSAPTIREPIPAPATGTIGTRDYNPAGTTGATDSFVRPPMPTTPPQEGHRWEWDIVARMWVQVLDTGEEEEEEKDPLTGENEAQRVNTRAQLQSFMQQYFAAGDIPELMAFVDDAIANDKSYNTIILELRNLPVYQRNFPEHSFRKENGYGFLTEGEILEYRQTIKRIAKQVSGVNLDVNPQSPGYMRTVGALLANDVDANEWTRRLETWEAFERMGPTVRGVLEQELGRRIPDDEAFMFMSQDFSTPELDRAYENALYRGQPAILGLGVRPQEEAEILRRYGIGVPEAFRGYQAMLTGGGGIAGLRRTEQLQALDSEIQKGIEVGNLPGTGSDLFNDTPFSLLFRAIQLNDQQAISYLQNQMANEVARFKEGGGVISQGTQAIGLLDPDERRRG